MIITTDPQDPRLGHGSDESPTNQSQAYLVLSKEERAKGFVRPYRDTYIHVGIQLSGNLRDLTDDEKLRYAEFKYVKFEEYGEDKSPLTGRYWTQAELDLRHCNGVTTMNREISETYARDPQFYGSTYCTRCCRHRPVHEFVWTDGSVVGS